MISIGVIGYGYWGPNLVRNFNETPGARVAWVTDLSAQRIAPVPLRYPAIHPEDACCLGRPRSLPVKPPPRRMQPMRQKRHAPLVPPEPAGEEPKVLVGARDAS